MKIVKTLALFSFFTLSSLNFLYAQEEKPKGTPVRFLIRGALELGGDRVAEVYFANGNTQSVKAGQGGSIAVGAEFQFPKVEKLLIHAGIGYKYVTTAADNVHIRLTRVPIHLTANWMAASKLRIGAGLATHRGIRFKADGLGNDIKFDGASGPMFEIAYAGFGLSYTAMKYTDQNNLSYSANAIGISITGVFPERK